MYRLNINNIESLSNFITSSEIHKVPYHDTNLLLGGKKRFISEEFATFFSNNTFYIVSEDVESIYSIPNYYNFFKKLEKVTIDELIKDKLVSKKLIDELITYNVSFIDECIVDKFLNKVIIINTKRLVIGNNNKKMSYFITTADFSYYEEFNSRKFKMKKIMDKLDI